MKKYRRTLTVIIILGVAFIMFAAFFGIYKTKGNGEKENIIPNLNLGMEFGKTRVITASVNQEKVTLIYDKEGKLVQEEEGKEYKEEDGYTKEEQPINNTNLKNISNYKKEKERIETKLEESGISEFFIEMHEITGKMTIQIPENENADNVQKIIEDSGSFIILDIGEEDYTEVLDDTYLKRADVFHSQGELETAIYIQLEFNEEGTDKIKKLNDTFLKGNVSEDSENSDSKILWAFLDNETIFQGFIYDNKIMLGVGLSSDNKEIQEIIKLAEQQTILLNAGTAPLVYDYSSETKTTQIGEEILFFSLAAIGIVFLIAYICLIVKFKAKGFISVYFQIGFLGILLLILKLTRVVVTMEGIAGIVISMVLEYIFTYLVLNKLNNDTHGMYKKANLEFFLNTLPIYIVAVVFTFATRAHISSFGTILFWGILMIYVYNFIFSKFVFENLNGRSE